MGRFHSQGVKNKLETEPPATLPRNEGVGGRGPLWVWEQEGHLMMGSWESQVFVCVFPNPSDPFQGIASLFC